MDETVNQSIIDTMSTLLNTPFSVLYEETLHIIDKLHFIRPDWFYAFIPLIVYLFLYSKKTQDNKNWFSVIDQSLLPFVLTKSDVGRQRIYPLLLIFIASSLCITALAGPVYKKLPQPVYREQSSLVVLLDLSASMNAIDIKPSRLSRAKLKLLDILKARKTGQTALIAYAADAFVVTPLTDDNATIANLVPALQTEMMPAQGSNLSLALAKAISLFNQAGIIKGHVLVIADDIHDKDETAIKKVSSQGHRLSILGVGTTEGGPIPLLESDSGGFLLDKNGAIVIPKFQPTKLRRFSLAGSGIYEELKANDNDVNRLTQLFESKDVAKRGNQDEHADTWQEEGPWLLLPLLLLAALWARRGWIGLLIPFSVTFLIAIPQPVHAGPETLDTNTPVSKSGKEEKPLLDTRNLWSSPDQKAMKAFDAGDNKKAAEHFTRSDWKASALYRNGDYLEAAKILENSTSSDDYYNKANALAKLGRYEDAIKAYDEALALDPNNGDASHNREQVKQALEDQQDNSEQNSDDSGQEQKQQENQDSSKSQDQDENKNQNDKDQQGQEDKASSEQSNQSQQNQQPQSKSEQDQAEEQELKQRDAEEEKKQQQTEQQEYDRQQQEQQEQQEQQQSNSVENKDDEESDTEDSPLEIEVNPMEASITEDEKATEQWLKRIPDDPGGLLRRKFLYQYKRTPNQTDSEEPW